MRGEVTQLLIAFRDGEREAFDRLVPLLYDDLRRVARGQLRRGRPGQTLDTTGLVHEVYLKMADQERLDARDREHFLAIAACAMRQVVIDAARLKLAKRRGGGVPPIPLDEAPPIAIEQARWLIDLDRAMERLEAIDERMARVVECRFFAGLTEEETAGALRTSLRTVQRDWKRARAWLKEELGGGDAPSAESGSGVADGASRV